MFCHYFQGAFCPELCQTGRRWMLSPWARSWEEEDKGGGVGTDGSLGLKSTPTRVRYALCWQAVGPVYVPSQMFHVDQGSNMQVLLATDRLFANKAEKSTLNLSKQPRMKGSAPLSPLLSGEAWIRSSVISTLVVLGLYCPGLYSPKLSCGQWEGCPLFSYMSPSTAPSFCASDPREAVSQPSLTP